MGESLGRLVDREVGVERNDAPGRTKVSVGRLGGSPKQAHLLLVQIVLEVAKEQGAGVGGLTQLLDLRWLRKGIARSAGGGWADLDTDQLIEDIYESRRISSRPPVEL